MSKNLGAKREASLRQGVRESALNTLKLSVYPRGRIRTSVS